MTFSDNQRSHDKFYSTEDHFKKPKEYFKKTLDLILNNSHRKLENSYLSILDVGSAAGDFLRYLESHLNTHYNADYFGIDVMESLLKESNILSLPRSENWFNIFGI